MNWRTPAWVALAMASIFLAAGVAMAVSIKPVTGPWVRLDQDIHHLKVDKKGRFLAFTESNGLGLRVLSLKSQNVYLVSRDQVGSSFFWSPDGYRLFYREIKRTKDGKPISKLMAYDCAINKNVVLDEMPFRTGLLTFDPRDLRMHLLHKDGIRTKRIYFPDERLARWQIAQRTENGKWLASQKGMLWVTQGGLAMRRMKDDNSPVDSFDVSPDGTSVAWATQDGRVYISKEGEDARFIAHGRDPSWHPRQPLLLFAGARMVGNKPVSYDLRVSDIKGSSRFLTTTQFNSERWPQWHPEGKQIIYTQEKTTDIFLMDFTQ